METIHSSLHSPLLTPSSSNSLRSSKRVSFSQSQFPLSLTLSPRSLSSKALKNKNEFFSNRGTERLGRRNSSFVVRCEAQSNGRITQQEFTEMAWQAIVSSPEVAKENKHQIVETEHLMKALLEQKNGLARRIFSKAGVDNTKLLETTDKFIQRQPKVLGESSGSMLGRDLEGLIQRSRDFKKEYGDSFVSVEHLVLGFAQDQRFGKQLFKDYQISLATLKKAIQSIRGRQTVIDQDPEGKYEALEKYGKDLTAMAQAGKLDPVIGRDDEVRRCIQILSRRTKNNPVLIGEPGVGKTAISEGLAQRIVRGDVPQALMNRKANFCDTVEPNSLLHVQTLNKFPREEIYGKVVMVRAKSTFPIQEDLNPNNSSTEKFVLTIKYLYHAGAKVLIATNWSRSKGMLQLPPTQTVADNLSSVLQLKVMPINWISDCTQSKMENLHKADVFLVENLSKFKEELANCSVFARKLSSGVDIFVNDIFSQSHKILASTVGVPRYCGASLAGFAFEEELSQIMEITRTTRQPYIAIIGGDNLNDKSAAVCFLASKCNGLAFVGMMAFQMIHAQGLLVPSRFVDPSAVQSSLKIIEYAHENNIPILLPKDFWCENDNHPNQLQSFPATGILEGWRPVDLGPSSVAEISSFLLECKKVLCIGPLTPRLPRTGSSLASDMAVILETIGQNGCDVIVVGTAACKEFSRPSVCALYENASVVWEFLKGRVLPGLSALDRAYPFEIHWETAFDDPTQPLVVDIGSGNGLFLFEMARRNRHLNFLGLEINKKLVNLCLSSVYPSGPRNRYFIATNATSTFRSIVSSYPGELILVLIQCPNPDFNNPTHRWRMLQRSLVEAIVDLLSVNGKVFVQSDVEAVALRMREEFIIHGKNKLAIISYEDDTKFGCDGWLKENPYGVRTDWEQHVIDRGAPMYRMLFKKVGQYLRK